jgi:molybdenum cofactor guanylyltransferase
MPKSIHSAIVLAGGRSSRMGADKGALRLGGTTILERVVKELRRGFDEVVIVAGPATDVASLPSTPGLRLVREATAFQGPVGALRLGLAAARAGVSFACACDLPFVSAKLAAALCEMVGDRDAAIPLVGGRLQMLHAAYGKSCDDMLAAMIGRGARRLRDLAPSLDARIVSEDELRPYDPELRSFFNVNTRADYARALRMVGE